MIILGFFDISVSFRNPNFLLSLSSRCPDLYGIDLFIPFEPKLAKTLHLTPTDHLANQALNQHQKSFDIAHQAPKNGSKKILSFGP